MVLLLTACLYDRARFLELSKGFEDADEDGWMAMHDCNDQDASVHPEAQESCDGADQNCDDQIDNDALDATDWFLDQDNDGYGIAENPRSACETPTGYTAQSGDCDDQDPNTYPEAMETPYDTLDQDCDGTDLTDQDGDGIDSVETGGADCDDNNPDVPTEEIPYDGTDQDCSGSDLVDVDQDGDSAWGYGGTDCNDDEASISGTTIETWDDAGIDNNCDGDLHNAVTWTSSEATTRFDGLPGGELGRVMGYWHSGNCLFVAAPYLNQQQGAVFAIPAQSGIHALSTPVLEGSGAYHFYSSLLSISAGGTLLSAEPLNQSVYLHDASSLCAGQSAQLADALLTLQSSETGYLGSAGNWVGDLDGDGIEDLVVMEPVASGGGVSRGQAWVVLSPNLQGEVIGVEEADFVLSGSGDNAFLSNVLRAEDYQNQQSYLIFSQQVTSPGQQAVFRVPLDRLNSGSVDQVSDGGLLTWVTDTIITMSNLGETSIVGADQLIDTFGESFDVRQLEGTISQGDGRWSAMAGDGEWLTGFVGLGDMDGGGRADIAVLADDWPLGQAQGRIGLMYGENIQDGFDQNIDALAYVATGTTSFDSFGYRLVPTGDFDGDGREDAAVSAYGSDLNGTSAGSVFLLPLP